MADKDRRWRVIGKNNGTAGRADVARTETMLGKSGHLGLGKTDGPTGYFGSVNAKFGTLSWLSIFPFVSKDEMFATLRNGTSYSREEGIELAGSYLAHELGHQLFHLGHPWVNKACVMRPVELLDFRGWRKNLDSTKCSPGSSPAMTPGAAGFPAVMPLIE